MKIFIFIIITILSQLQAQTVIFGADKNEDTRDKNMEKLHLEVSKNTELKELQNQYDFEYSKEKFGDFFAISINDIDNIDLKNKIFFILKPIFKDIFVLASKDIHYQEDSTVTKDDDTLDNFLLKYIILIDKWHIMVIISILSLIFLYKRFIKLKEIKGMQKNFKDSQDVMQDKIDNII
jgi:hypothetical protein